ncbi:MAG: phosphoribulokinase, partial [Demequina sp.]|nr:phosphoribulokinase [Demequina sp.]
MSTLHPIVAVTGSSGAGTTSVRQTFENIFRREAITSAYVEGDAFHRMDRMEMQEALADAIEKGDHTLSHFGEEANLFSELEALFRDYGATGSGRVRHYLHDADEAAPFGKEPGTFTPWRDLEEGSDLLFYEGLHGAVKTDKVDIASHVDLAIGVVPVINLEWIQKLTRDRNQRGYTTEAVTETILRRMPDYVRYITPQFSRTHVNFQRVPVVDTSNPFIARAIPSAAESMLVIRFARAKGIDFPYLLSMLSGSFMSRPNTIVVPGGLMDLAMQLTFTPMLWRLMELKK